MKNKIKKSAAKKLFNLLSDAEAISDGERCFWLENFPNLKESEQECLAEVIRNSEKELQKERDAHFARVAEIDTKCVAQLQEIAKKNNLKASAGDETNLDYDEDEILLELQQAGEL